MRKNWGKHIILLLTTVAIAGTTLTAPVTASASEVQGEVVEMTELVEAEVTDETEATENTEEADEIEETEEAEATEGSEAENKDEKKEKPKKNVNYKEKTLTITKAGFVADSFNGVDAVYRKGPNDGSSKTYSCAAYIKKYYKKMYDVSVYNLFGGATPKTYEGKKIGSVKSPKVGDIAYKNGHWAIVKKVNDNDTVTLIEQNWKWGGNQCKINRTVDTSSLKYFRLK